ncbi:MAG: hypothetical protein K2Q01_02165 [Rickettsiales bacterium]|nr:hypothetical protein [Rickettsiales bacterium]
MTTARANKWPLAVAMVVMIATLDTFFFAFWDHMGHGPRLISTLASGLVLHILVMKSWHSPLPVVGTMLLPMAALLQTVGWFVLINGFMPALAHRSDGTMLVALLMGAQEYAIARHYRKNSAAGLCFIYAYAFALALLHFLGADERVAFLCLGASMLLAAHGFRHTMHAPALAASGCLLGGAALGWLTWDSGAHVPVCLPVLVGLYACAHRFHSRSLLWACSATLMLWLGLAAYVTLLSGPLWPLTLPIYGAGVFVAVNLTLKAQKRC